MRYYVADTHFGDERIIGLCNRPFCSIEDMTNTIVEKWNSVVDDNDHVYVVGDYACGDISNLEEITNALHGHIHLIPGNHDMEWIHSEKAPQSVDVMSVIETVIDDGVEVVLCHYPLCSYEGSLRGAVHVYGHVHNNFNAPNYSLLKYLKNSYNAGVDVNGFVPKTLEQLMGVNQ